MLADGAVRTHIYKRGGIFFLPLGFFKQAAAQCGGEFVLKQDWSQVLFLCRDAIGVSFWLQRAGEKPLHTLVGLDMAELSRQEMPELIDLWLWKHINETWDEVRAIFVGTRNVSEYARDLARIYPHCVVARNPGLN